MMTFKNKLTVLLCCMLPIGLLQSCSEKEVLEASQNTSTLQATEGCPDEVANDWEWEVMPSTPPPPYDVTLHSWGTMPDPNEYAVNGVVCECEEENVCVFFNYTQPLSPGYSFLITVVNGSAITQIPVQSNPQGGYIGYPSPPQLAAALSKLYGQPVTPGDLALVHHICFPADGSDVYIDVDFDGDLPGDYDTEAIINNVIGLCIVDNLGDPNHQ